MNPVYIFSTIGISLLFFGALWSNQSYLLGTAPTEEFTPEMANSVGHGGQLHDYKDPDIERLKEATALRPDDKKVWIHLVKALLKKMDDGIVPRSIGSIEAIDALGEVLRIDPNDPQALMLMADLSFDQQVFSKAKEYYERYLAVNAEDDSARARYASTLTFLGEPTRAIEILKDITSRDPSNFKVNAFLALAYAQVGDSEQVKIQGNKALALAPDEESKKRLNDFLSRFENKPPQTQTTNVATSLEGYFLRHQIIGPKIKDIKNQDGVLVLSLDSFPMSAMPPFAREKLESGIISFVKENDITDFSEVRFLDAATGKQEGKITLNSDQ